MKAQLQPKFGRKPAGKSKKKAAGDEDAAAVVDDFVAEIASAGASVEPLISELPPPPPIPLELSPALPNNDHKYAQIIIKVEGLTQGAGLTAGRNNGDRTWSLNQTEIDGLHYVLEHGPLIPHTLQVRVIGVADDQATTLVLLETDIGTDAAASPLRLFSEKLAERAAADSADGDDLETVGGLSKALNQSRQMARTRIAAAKAAAEAGDASQPGTAASEEVVALRGKLQEIEARLAEKAKAFDDAEAAWEKERRSLAAEIQARADGVRDVTMRATREADAKGAAHREREAAAAWQREKELLLAEANVRVEEAIESAKPEKVRVRLEAEFEKEKAKLIAEADRRVAETEKAARADAEARVKEELGSALNAADAALRKARDDSAKAQADARAEWDRERYHLTAEAEARAAKAAEAARSEAEQTLAAARSEWEAGTKALKTEANKRIGEAAAAARAEADRAASAQLAAATGGWEAERAALGERLAAATAALETERATLTEKLAAATGTLEAERARFTETHAQEIARAVESARADAEARHATALAEAKKAWEDERKAVTAAAEQYVSEASTSRSALEAELARAKVAISTEVERARATWEIEQAATRAEYQTKIEAARREGEAAGRAAAAETFSGDESSALATARAEWELKLTETVARVREEAAIEAKSAQASTLGVAVDAARAEWRAERQQIEEEARQRLEEARREIESARTALDDARASWEAEKATLLTDADARIAAAGLSDGEAATAEAARRDAAVQAALASAEKRWRRELDVQADAAEKRIAAMRVSAETELDVQLDKAVKSALAEARMKWEAEVEERLAEARNAWQADEAGRIVATEKQLEGAFTKRLEAVEARLASPADAAAGRKSGGKAKKSGKSDPKLLAAISQWKRATRGSRAIRLPRPSRRMVQIAACVALVAGGAMFYEDGIAMLERYAPVVDAEVGPRADMVTKQARDIAAAVEAAIRERLKSDAAAADNGNSRPPDEDVLTSILRRAWVKPDAANIRAEPSLDSALVVTVLRGTEVEQLGARGVWIHVRAGGRDGREGWMHASLLTSTAPR